MITGVQSEAKTCTIQHPRLGHGRYLEHCGPGDVFLVLLGTKLFERIDCLQCGGRLPMKLSTRKSNRKVVIIIKKLSLYGSNPYMITSLLCFLMMGAQSNLSIGLPCSIAISVLYTCRH